MIRRACIWKQSILPNPAQIKWHSVTLYACSNSPSHIQQLRLVITVFIKVHGSDDGVMIVCFIVGGRVSWSNLYTTLHILNQLPDFKETKVNLRARSHILHANFSSCQCLLICSLDLISWLFFHESLSVSIHENIITETAFGMIASVSRCIQCPKISGAQGAFHLLLQYNIEYSLGYIQADGKVNSTPEDPRAKLHGILLNGAIKCNLSTRFFWSWTLAYACAATSVPPAWALHGMLFG